MQDTVLESNKKGKGFSIIILDMNNVIMECQLADKQLDLLVL